MLLFPNSQSRFNEDSPSLIPTKFYWHRSFSLTRNYSSLLTTNTDNTTRKSNIYSTARPFYLNFYKALTTKKLGIPIQIRKHLLHTGLTIKMIGNTIFGWKFQYTNDMIIQQEMNETRSSITVCTYKHNVSFNSMSTQL